MLLADVRPSSSRAKPLADFAVRNSLDPGGRGPGFAGDPGQTDRHLQSARRRACTPWWQSLLAKSGLLPMPLVEAGEYAGRPGNGVDQRRARGRIGLAVDRSSDPGHAGHRPKVSSTTGSEGSVPCAPFRLVFQWFGAGQGTGRWFVVGIALRGVRRFRLGDALPLGGRAIYATGSDPGRRRTSRASGRRVGDLLYLRGDGCPDKGSMRRLTCVQFPAVDPKTGDRPRKGLVVAAVVVGGTAVSGGRGDVDRHPDRRAAPGARSTRRLVYLHTSGTNGRKRSRRGSASWPSRATAWAGGGVEMDDFRAPSIRVSPSRAILAALIAVEVTRLRRDQRHELRLAGQRVRGPAARRRGRAAGGCPHPGHRHRRN